MENRIELEQYVRKRLAEIDYLDERRFAKELLLEGLIPIFDLLEKRYEDLEKRIWQEIEIHNEKYAVFMTVIKKDDYDPINSTLFPICPEFMEGREENQENDEKLAPYLVYFNGSFRRRMEFEKTGVLSGIDSSGKEHVLHICKAECFQKAIKDLHQMFVTNQIGWVTVNTAYLDRFYEVYCDEKSDIRDWKIDFKGWEADIKTGMLPLWNIEKFTFDCRKFMVPCIDAKYYEHELNLRNYDSESGYMIGLNEDILKIRHEKDRIIMTSYKESFQNWVAYRFAGNVDISSPGYRNEILGNARKKSFFQNYTEYRERRSGSKTELFWMVESFEDNSHVELIDCAVTSKEPPVYLEGDMNPFSDGTVFLMETRKILVLSFRRKRPDADFCEDMVRFFTSQIQMSFCEYKCVGILVE